MAYSDDTTLILADRYLNMVSASLEVQLLSDDVAVDLSGTTIDVWYRRNNEIGPIVSKISIGSGITVTDESNGKFTIDAFTCEFPIGSIVADIKITQNGNSVIYRKFEYEVKRTITE